MARAVVGLLKLGHQLRRWAFLAIGSGALLLLLGIVLPRDRQKALLGGGVTLATVALVLFFLPPIARTALTYSMAHAQLRPVAAGVWDDFTGELRVWALVLAGMGIVLASAGASFASRVEVEHLARLYWQALPVGDPPLLSDEEMAEPVTCSEADGVTPNTCFPEHQAVSRTRT